MRRMNPQSSLPGVPYLMVASGALLLVIAALLTPTPVGAQCGSSSSSCMTCHEINARAPVNTAGDWHVDHASSDFCVLCHAGNAEAAAQNVAHEGMIDPLVDSQASCATCHPDTYADQAQVYAVALASRPSATRGADDSSVGADFWGDPPPAASRGGDTPSALTAAEDAGSGASDAARTGNLILAFAASGLTLLGVALVWRFEHVGEALRHARAAAAPSQAAQALSARLDQPTDAALRALLADPVRGPALVATVNHLAAALLDTRKPLDSKDRALLKAIAEQLGAEQS